MKVIGVIPARYASTRLPGKPLMEICGKPMLWWVYERCKGSQKLDEVIVAIDDERIRSFCEESNIPYVMTASDHRTAANRLHELSEKIDADFYVQINGDEPLIDVKCIDRVVPNEIPQEYAFGTNIVCPIFDKDQIDDVSNIKVVFDAEGNMKYMSRVPIPFGFKSENFTYYKHVGILGYNKKMLDFYSESVPGPLEVIEGIDTLRFIDYNKDLRVMLVDKYDSLSVDTQKDLDYVRNLMEKQIDGKRHQDS